jgi:hypothetical protein
LVTDFSWHRFAAIQIWFFVLFLLYTFVSELNSHLGEGRLRRMLFLDAASCRVAFAVPSPSAREPNGG